MKIKPCPFCGGPGEVNSYYPAWPSTDCTFEHFGVICPNSCDAFPKVAAFFTEGEAIKVWNMRANPITEYTKLESEHRPV